VIKRMFKPKAALPMGFALGLLVLWELGAMPEPFATDPGPIARAAYAIGLAVLGALVGFGAQWLMSRLWGGKAGGAGDADGT
jgi:hypothetical protein